MGCITTPAVPTADRKSTRLNSSYANISYAVFFFNDTATTEIYTLSLHDALPISHNWQQTRISRASRNDEEFFEFPSLTFTTAGNPRLVAGVYALNDDGTDALDGLYYYACDTHCRSEEHTSELQLRQYLVCRLFF